MTLSIGELSRATGVKVTTIRYYEKEGLLSEPVRTEGNQRRYRQADLERLRFIRHSRDLGLAMPAIRDLLALNEHPEAPCTRADEIAAERLADVRKRIQQLKQLEGELMRIAASCDGTHAASDCNVLRAFADHDLCHGEH